MITRYDEIERTNESGTTAAAGITPFGEELSEEMLTLVSGGRPNEIRQSKVCSAGGSCWADKCFGPSC